MDNEEFKRQVEDNVAEAKRRAREAHPEHAGLPARGPIAEMLLQGGMSPERVTKVCRQIAGVNGDALDQDMPMILSEETRINFLISSYEAINRHKENNR